VDHLANPSVLLLTRFSKSGDNFKRIGFQHDEFGNLLFEFVWYIKKFKPKAFLIENVVGLLSIDGGYQIEKTIKILQETGYKVTKAVLNAVDYGVPQSRLRLFIVGIRTKKNFNFPNKEVGAVASAKVLEKSLAGVANHVTRHHRAQSIIRYMELRYGERDKLGRVDRINPNLPSKTVIAGGNRGGGRSHLHPHTPRTLSVRESARLQTFPDDYVFSGTPARQFTQVGNAVPPVLALKLARAIHSVF
jgi:DNA (cytosine-5)-methyltransferase 1